MTYWDTSALLKLYANESDSGDFIRLMISQDSALAISFLHQVEMAFAIQAKEGRGEIVVGAAKKLIRSFDRHISENRYCVIPWGQDVVARSREILEECQGASPPIAIRSLDGIHLGAILAAGISKLITADERMKTAARALGIDVIEP